MAKKGKEFKYTSKTTAPKYDEKRAATEEKRTRLRNKKGRSV